MAVSVTDLNWQPVQSSNIKAVSYVYANEEGSSGDLYVMFKGDSTYVYRGVPQEEYVAFLASESKGKYLHANIKGRYSYARL